MQVDADDLGVGIAESVGASGGGEAVIGRVGGPERHGDHCRLVAVRLDPAQAELGLAELEEVSPIQKSTPC
jgi:hypothetical protein